MSKKNKIRIAWPVALLFLPSLLLYSWRLASNPSYYLKRLDVFDPLYILNTLDFVGSDYFTFFPQRALAIYGSMAVLLFVWWLKPNWLTGALLLIPFTLASNWAIPLGLLAR